MDVQTSENPKHGVKCQYGGQKMRSLLERRLAMLLDGLQIEWEYEKDYFQLNDGQINYLPDFYLPKHNQYIEAKGVYSDKDEQKIEAFTKETDHELIMIKSDASYFVLTHKRSENPSFGPAHINKCSSCQSYSIVPEYGSYECRVCGTHSGDSDIVKYNFMGASKSYQSNTNDLQLIDYETINNWIREVKAQ